jgi:hypothetical protein
MAIIRMILLVVFNAILSAAAFLVGYGAGEQDGYERGIGPYVDSHVKREEKLTQYES